MSWLGEGPLPPQGNKRLVRPALLPLALLLLGTAPLQAQQRIVAVLPQAPPSRAESLLAHGRLRAAEDAFYSAVDAAPRSPSARGELGRYLASRGRFAIADVLYREALRFGADTPSISQALVAMASYTLDIDRRLIPGVRLPVVEAAREAARLEARVAAKETAPERRDGRTVPFRFTHTPGALGSFDLRGPGGTRRAVFDPGARGLSVSRADDAALRPRSFGARGPGAPLLIDALWIGETLVLGVEARVDPGVPDGEVRVGLDLLWSFQPIFDEIDGTMTLSAPGTIIPESPSALQIPFVLGFPGIWLIPTVGDSPVEVSSARARTLLAKSRWWWNGVHATLSVER